MVLPINVNGERIDLICPDYGGEQVNNLTDLMEFDSNWGKMINGSNHWILFIRPQEITTNYDLSVSSYEKIEIIKSKQFISPKMSMQSKLIELIQSLMYVKNAYVACSFINNVIYDHYESFNYIMDLNLS